MKRTVLLFTLSLAMFAQGGFRGPGRYQIFSPLSNKVLDMDRNDGRTIIQYENRNTDNQTWDISDAGGGYYYIRNGMNGNALAVQDDRNSTPLVAEPFANSPRQQWRFDSGENTTAILVNRNGKAIDIPFGSTNNSTKINSYNQNSEVNQRWQFQAAAGFNSNNNNRYDRSGIGRGGNRSANRYDTPGASTSTQRDAYGAYLDSYDNTYKMDGDGVCIYRDRDFRGDAVCANVRDGRAQWNGAVNNIGSIRFFGRANTVQLFDRPDFRGNAIEITGEQRNYNSYRNNLRSAPQSVRVY